MTGQNGRAAPDWLDVSRETLATLERYVGLVEKWTPAINLVSRRSVTEIWDRHLLDSAQLFTLIPETARHLVDLGSGGGFPGVVLAILARDTMPDLRLTLVEADQRKATFLAEAARHLSLRCTIMTQRIESAVPQGADVLTARALAPLVTLCGYAKRHLDPSGIAIFSKGAQVGAELVDARQVWSFAASSYASKSDAEATILAITDLHHV